MIVEAIVFAAILGSGFSTDSYRTALTTYSRVSDNILMEPVLVSGRYAPSTKWALVRTLIDTTTIMNDPLITIISPDAKTTISYDDIPTRDKQRLDEGLSRFNISLPSKTGKSLGQLAIDLGKQIRPSFNGFPAVSAEAQTKANQLNAAEAAAKAETIP